MRVRVPSSSSPVNSTAPWLYVGCVTGEGLGRSCLGLVGEVTDNWQLRACVIRANSGDGDDVVSELESE